MKNQWIFKSFLSDFLALWAAAFPLIFILFLIPQGRAWGLLALVAYVFIDSGHVYVTALRTYFRKKVILKNPKYVVVPIICFIVFFVWAYLGAPYLWSFVIYATFYHNTKQHFGILKWYEKLNRPAPKSSFYLYALTILPFIGFHFKKFAYGGIYHENEFFFFPNQYLFLAVLLINIAILLQFILHNLRLKQSGQFSFPVFASILFPSLINFVCFSLGQTLDQVQIPIVVIHGVSYYFLTAHLIENSELKQFRFGLTFCLIVFVTVIFGYLEDFTLNRFVEIASPEFYRGRLSTSLLVALIVVPSITHYILDGMIWRKSDFYFSQVFKYKNKEPILRL